MKAVEFETNISSGNSITIPLNFTEEFKENELVKVILLKEDAVDDNWSKLAAKNLFKEDDSADDIYETLRK